MARNRKRAKARQARRSSGAPGPAPGLATARIDAPDPIEHASPDVDLAEAQLALGRPELAREPEREPEPEDDRFVDTDDVEEAGPVEGVEEARPVGEVDDVDETRPVGEVDDVDEARPVGEVDEVDETEVDEVQGAAPAGEVDEVQDAGPADEADEPEEEELEADELEDGELADDELERAGAEVVAPGAPRASPERRLRSQNRLINFIQGSWRELQRVQWPDRRQVMQATGVVIGFVIVAGVFLGVADFLAQKLVSYILK